MCNRQFILSAVLDVPDMSDAEIKKDTAFACQAYPAYVQESQQVFMYIILRMCVRRGPELVARKKQRMEQGLVG